jgi:hypothetical protein
MLYHVEGEKYTFWAESPLKSSKSRHLKFKVNLAKYKYLVDLEIFLTLFGL